MNQFQYQLRTMGFSTYDEYLNSAHWAEFKKQYQKHKSCSCAVCGLPNSELHHVTYCRLGRERFKDILPLCRTHHQQVHDWLSAHNMPPEQTKQAVTEIKSALSCGVNSLYEQRRAEYDALVRSGHTHPSIPMGWEPTRERFWELFKYLKMIRKRANRSKNNHPALSRQQHKELRRIWEREWRKKKRQSRQ